MQMEQRRVSAHAIRREGLVLYLFAALTISLVCPSRSAQAAQAMEICSRLYELTGSPLL
jgi:hypothetical protein